MAWVEGGGSLLRFETALRDLDYAFEMLNDGKWYRAALFAQQADEKVLRAFPLLLREPPRKGHTIGVMLGRLKNAGLSLPPNLEESLPSLGK